MNDQRDLEGFSALVTGATSGIGKAAAEELGRHVSPARSTPGPPDARTAGVRS
jgi:NAD(P)-dependent dehydrogenase (short-subunit alcohol dehydrogenase family)